MALPWNPNSPAVYGIEVPLIRSGRTNLLSYTKGICQKVRSSAAQTVRWFYFPMPVQDRNTEFDRVGPFAVDVYDADPLDTVPATRTHYGPNAFTDRVVFVTAAGATTNLHLSIDEGVDTADHSDYIYAPTTAASRIDLQFGTAAFPASQRIYDVRVRARVRGGDLGFQFVNAGAAVGQKIKTGYTGVVGSTGFRTVTLSFGEVCPWTGEPWVSADIQALDAGTFELRVSREDNASGFFAPTIAAVDLDVLHGTEHRVARGITDGLFGLASEAEWAQVLIETPAGAEWSKLNATDYWIVLRRARLEQNPYIAYEPVAPREGFDVHWVEPPAGAEDSTTWPLSFEVTTGSGGRVQAKTADSQRRYAMGWITGDHPDFTTFPGADTQPLGTVDAIDLDDGEVRQLFASPASASFGSIRLAFVPGPVGSVEQTTVKIRRHSDDVQMGSTITLDRETLTEQGTRLGNGTPGEVWEIQRVFSTAPVLVLGTAYYVEIEGGDMRPVFVDAPHHGEVDVTFPFYTYDNVDPTNSAYNMGNALAHRTFDNDQTERLLVGGGGDDTHWAGDLLFVIGQSPATLTNLSIDQDEQLLTHATPDTEQCPSIDGLPLARVSWTASALSDADFLRYEVERYDPTTDTWTQIARLTSKSATTWYDPDIRFGVAEAYRVRQVRSGEVPSEWLGDTTTSIYIEAPGCGLYFTVAEDQEWNLAALDVYGGGPADRDFDWLDRKVLVPMFGRDYQVAFSPTETRGVTFQRTLLLNAISAMALPTYDTFDPLRDLARAPVSAVCVRDHEGNRWYCALDVPSGKLRASGEFAWAQVAMTEVAGGPLAYEGRGQSLGGS
jgi:hypothetical protein